MPIGRLHQRLRCGFAVFLLQIFFQGTRVNADANGDIFITRRLNHRPYAVFAADIAWIDAQAIYPQFRHPQRDLIIEVNIADERHVDLFANLTKGFGGVH